jgi:hypothetical protein
MGTGWDPQDAVKNRAGVEAAMIVLDYWKRQC